MKWSLVLSKESSPWKAVLLWVSIILSCVLAQISFGGSYGFLCAILLPLAVSKYFITLSFELDEAGVKIKTGPLRKQRPWSYYRRYRRDSAGIFLSPFLKPSRLDAFRGDYLYFSKDLDSERVVSFVSAHLERR